jgi:hypothetical protein
VIPDAEIICRREPFGGVCEWKGDPRKGVARVGGVTIFNVTHDKRIRAGQVFKLHNLTLRVVQFPVLSSAGVGYADVAYVMLESPRAELYALYRRAVERLLRLTLNLEARYNGFMLRPCEGREMPVTKWLYETLL